MSPRFDRRVALALAVAISSLAAATLGVHLLETFVAVPNASAVYLVAVVATAIVAGAPGAVVASIASFLLYDFFFTFPYYTFTVRDPAEWVSLVLLLFVGIVVGQLAALQRSRARDALAREREARGLFQVSFALATRESADAVLPAIARLLRDETRLDRVWIALGESGQERAVADSGGELPAALPSHQHLLRRMPGDEPAQWLRIHQPTHSRASRASAGLEAYRVRVEAAGAVLGSIWALTNRSKGEPDDTETRLLAAAADQVGQALAHDRLAAESRAAEIAQQSDELKSALLQSVSHDLRTPLATIRAAAGTLRPGSSLSPQDQIESVEAIDREVEYLNRLVTNLLDLSRIEAGALRAERDLFELDDLVGRTLDRLGPRLAGRQVDVELGGPPVLADPIFLDEVVTNAVENALKYTPAGTRLRLAARPLPDRPFVRLTIEDAGQGVPEEHLPHLFEKFYRVPGAQRSSRSGVGIGLAVVRGLTEAMGGSASARRGELGGLAIDLDLPIGADAVELVGGASA
ncbi:MAG: sensor histidine kinase [Candidatus Limnocylindria bacterium]